MKVKSYNKWYQCKLKMNGKIYKGKDIKVFVNDCEKKNVTFKLEMGNSL